MDWQDKLSAMQNLCECSLKMRKPNDWYVSAPSRDIHDDGILIGSYGNGTSPQQAVENDWDIFTNKLKVHQNIKAGDKYFVWAGYMWKQVYA